MRLGNQCLIESKKSVSSLLNTVEPLVSDEIATGAIDFSCICMNNFSPFSFPEPALPLSIPVSLAKGNEGPGNENDCSQEACCEERKSLAHRGFVVCSLCWKNGLGYFLDCWTFFGSSVSLIGRFWVIKVSWPHSRH